MDYDRNEIEGKRGEDSIPRQLAAKLVESLYNAFS